MRLKEDMIYALHLYLYFDDLYLRKPLSIIQVCQEKQFCNKGLDTKILTSKGFSKENKDLRIIIDEKLTRVGSYYIWL
jgi:hypothetical protein